MMLHASLVPWRPCVFSEGPLPPEVKLEDCQQGPRCS